MPVLFIINLGCSRSGIKMRLNDKKGSKKTYDDENENGSKLDIIDFEKPERFTAASSVPASSMWKSSCRDVFRLLRENRVVQEREDEHNLEPSEVREGRPGSPGTARHVLKPAPRKKNAELYNCRGSTEANTVRLSH